MRGHRMRPLQVQDGKRDKAEKKRKKREFDTRSKMTQSHDTARQRISVTYDPEKLLGRP